MDEDNLKNMKKKREKIVRCTRVHLISRELYVPFAIMGKYFFFFWIDHVYIVYTQYSLFIVSNSYSLVFSVVLFFVCVFVIVLISFLFLSFLLLSFFTLCSLFIWFFTSCLSIHLCYDDGDDNYDYKVDETTTKKEETKQHACIHWPHISMFCKQYYRHAVTFLEVCKMIPLF